MKQKIALLVLMVWCNGAMAVQLFDDRDLGLSKTSVYDEPAPEKYRFNSNFPGSGTVLPRAYPGAPPQIPHGIQSFTPITAKQNMCKQCHHNPALIGKRVEGQPTAIPTSHYTDQRHAPGKVGIELVGARYVCTQCHVAQADTAPMVENGFGQAK